MTNKTEKILEALSKLDAGNDNHWTNEGAPRLETLRLMVGDPSVSRDDVNTADQAFTRQALVAKAEAEASAAEAEQAVLREQAEAAKQNEPEKVETVEKEAELEQPLPEQTAFAPHAMGYNASGQITSPLGTEIESGIAGISNLDREIHEGEEMLAEIDAQLVGLASQRNKVQGMLDILCASKIKDELPHHIATQNEISRYLDSQRKQRDLLANKVGEFGMRALPMSSRSLLDQRLAQKGRPPAR